MELFGLVCKLASQFHAKNHKPHGFYNKIEDGGSRMDIA